MSEGSKALVGFLALLAFRFAYYQVRLRKITTFGDRYRHYLRDESASPEWLVEHTNSFTRMMRECAAEAGTLTRLQEAGYGYLEPVRIAAEDNLGVRDPEVVTVTNRTILRIQGHYRAERNRTFSPLYWVEFLVFLPREVLRHLGVGSDKLAVRVSDLAWWVLVGWQVVSWITGKGSLIQVLRILAR